MKQLVTALQEIAALAPERRHAKAPRGDALARQRIGNKARAALATIRPAGERAREYTVEILATNRTVLVSWRGKAHNRSHALFMALAELGYRMDIDRITIEKVGKVPGQRVAERAAEGERAASYRLTRDVRAGFGPGAPGYEATYPAGTEVIKVQGGLGYSFAIASEALVREKTNPHDAAHRYVFVPADAVAPV